MIDRDAPDEAEFDLMAYVDGHLEDDPKRKARVEERLRLSPEDAARVAAYRAQNAALRRRYGRRAEEAVPDRLYRVLRDRTRRPARMAARVAAVLALTTAAGMSGWWVGRSAPPAGEAPLSMTEIDRIDRLVSRPGTAPAAQLAGTSDAALLGSPDESVSLRLRVPDLSARGYVLTGKETVHLAGDRMVQLTYAGQDGQTFSIFLRPRTDARNPQIELVRRNGLWVAYWREGPLSSALAARLPREKVRTLAREVRREMQHQDRAAPKIQASPAASALPGLAADSAAPGPAVPASARHPDAVQPIVSDGILRTN